MGEDDKTGRHRSASLARSLAGVLAAEHCGARVALENAMRNLRQSRLQSLRRAGEPTVTVT